MEFCPECGAMLFPKDGVLKCNSCGYSNETIDEKEYNLKKEIKAGETVTNLGEDVDMRSTIKETCPECEFPCIEVHRRPFFCVPNSL